jgi:2-hydroxychromene-2-carboxylate isomerase
MPPIILYFDLGSPYAYLTTERIGTVFPEPVEWQPVLLGGLFKLAGRSSWAIGDTGRRRAGMAEVQRRTRRYGLPALRWPENWPTDYLFAMRACTFAFRAGRGREFTQAAFHAAFRQGKDLSDPTHVLAAAHLAGLDPDATGAATQDPAVKQKLRQATDVAYARGVVGVPTIAVGDELFWGDDRVEDAVAASVG